ncbi:MAG: carbon monoxide dehydrogenase [Burkholderiales bacterium PBB5]|nr:MAG: carbon monoxide dehydrogenase [Burkholderiales bacterium PBB5]
MHFEPDTRELPQALQAMLARERAGATPAAGLARRSFLKLGAASGLAVGVFPLTAAAQAAGAAAATGLKPTQQPAAFVQIARDGSTTITINRLEFGQGVQTALPMVLAEELDADWSLVKAVHGNNDPAYVDPAFGIHITGGSGSINRSYTQYRELGARVRAMLVAAAAAQWQVDPATVRTRAGVLTGPAGQQLRYGDVADAAMALPVPEAVVLKNPKDFRLIGQPTNRLDAKAKSSGQQHYGIDMQLPGMLSAVVARPPVFGAKLAAVDDRAAKAVKGVKAVLRIPVDRGGEGVVVIADGYWPAKMGRDALQLQWDSSGVQKVDSAQQLAQYRALARQPGPRKFDADVSGLASAKHQIEAEFHFPYLAHAPMEPLNCTVQLGADAAELWLGSQMPGLDGFAASKVLGVAPGKVKVNVQMAGGGFGRRAIPSSDYVVEACAVAKAAQAAGVSGPIRTLWSREDDIKGGYYRPMHVHTAKIGFDAHGKISAWDHVIVGQSIMAGTAFEGMMVKDGIDGTATEGMKEPYEIPMRLTVHHPKVNVPVLWWRSVGSTHTAFVMETLIDQIARTTQQDPVAYRLALIGEQHPRHRAALQLADPRTLDAQVQGGALRGLGMCLPGAAVTLKDGVVEQSNFHDYPVPRITQMPQIAVHTVPSADAPTGMGEPGLPPLAPAFANAIAALTGKPLRALPFVLG